jgi:hypothetical protein
MYTYFLEILLSYWRIPTYMIVPSERICLMQLVPADVVVLEAATCCTE